MMGMDVMEKVRWRKKRWKIG